MNIVQLAYYQVYTDEIKFSIPLEGVCTRPFGVCINSDRLVLNYVKVKIIP